MIALNIGFVQVLWFKKIRTTPLLLWFIAGDSAGGMWLERFVIVVISLSQDFLPSPVGDLHADAVGLGNLYWHSGTVHVPFPALCPRLADDFGF